MLVADPCVFCSHERPTKCLKAIGTVLTAWVECRYCKASGPRLGADLCSIANQDAFLDKAIEAWNKRVSA